MSFGKQLSRRELGKAAFGGALGAAVAGWPELSFANPASVSPEPSGIHLSCNAPVNPTDQDILFFKQLGLDTIYVRGTRPQDQTVEGLRALKKRYNDAGLQVADVDNPSVDEWLNQIVINLPGRDKAIEALKSWIRTLGEAGFDLMEPLMYNATGTVNDGVAPTRGDTAGKEFDLNSTYLTGSPWRVPSAGAVNDLLFGRKYSSDEIWENYTYFIKQITPVAEEAGVRIAFDNDDPPLPSVFGVPRLMSRFEDIKRVLEIADSPNVGLCFTTGEWIEGDKAMGIDIPGAIQYFGSRKKIFGVYLRNSSATLPRFHETYIDDGCYDMFKIMKALVDVKYNGVASLDHWMHMVGGRRTYEAFGIGYLRAMLQCAQRGHAG